MVGANQPVKNGSIGLIDKVKCFEGRIFQYKKLVADFSDEFSGSGTSRVFPRDLNEPSVFLSERIGALHKINVVRKNVSSQLQFSGIFSVTERGAHVAGLSDAGSPSNEPQSDVGKNKKERQKIQRSVVIGDPPISLGLSFFRDYWGGIFAGLCFAGIVFWIDYLDRRAHREYSDGKKRPKRNFRNTKLTQR